MFEAPRIRRSSAGRRPASAPARLFRRGVLGGAIGAAGVGMVAGGGRGAWSAAQQPATPPSFVTGQRFVEPPVLRSAGGRLDVTLEARWVRRRSPAATSPPIPTMVKFRGRPCACGPAKHSASRSPTGWTR